MRTEFGEDISICSWVIAVLVKITLPLTNVLASLCDGELKFLLFFFYNYSYSLSIEYFCSGLVLIGAKNLGLVHKSRFWIYFKMAQIPDLVEQIEGIQGFQKCKSFESSTNSLGVMSDFTFLFAVVPPIGWLGRAFASE